MHIPSARWQQIRTLFHQALEREPSARAGFLAEMSGDDADLRQEVESLLNALEQADDFLEQPAGRSLPEILGDDVTPSMVGRRVGHYDIRREIGVGGMGAVYEGARADDQYQKRVAIKLIRRGMDSELAIRRFRHERQILASLDHPDIAGLLDGGVTADGAPLTRRAVRVFTPEYSSPEQIRGTPITTSCDVYSLGAVLYELLTGRHPFQFENRSLFEIEYVICEEDPPKPSAAVTEDSAQRLGEKASKLRGQLAGELDSIVMMVMRKEPERRYASVEQFSNDVRRYLEGRRITAQRDWPGYRAGKFIRRNKAAVGLAHCSLSRS